jgi:nucleoside-diphosphate-sugar epimerase
VHNGDSDHEASLNALLSGLSKKATPGYLLHLSGTGIVSDWRSETNLGKQNPKIWSDISSLDEITALPKEALHRNTETILHNHIAQHPGQPHIAIMCPPDIYGRGHGLAKTHSALIPMYVQEIKNLGGKPFYYAEGTNMRSWVHIDDLMKLYLRVVEAAASNTTPEKYFNANGYYFASTQEHSQIELARAAGKVLHTHGVIESPEPVQVDLEQLDSMANFPGFPKLARYLFASNSRSRAERAQALFGYMGEAPGLIEGLESDVLDVIKQ